MADNPAPRTEQQNRALHLYFDQVAWQLNDAGLSINEVLENFTMELDWNKDNVKEILWRTAQKRMLGKQSTRDLSKQEDITLIYEAVNRFLSQFGIHVPFPSSGEIPESLKGYGDGKINVEYPSEEGNLPNQF